MARAGGTFPASAALGAIFDATTAEPSRLRRMAAGCGPHTHTKVVQGFFRPNGFIMITFASQQHVLALGGNCPGARGDAETANPGPLGHIIKVTQKEADGTWRSGLRRH